MLSKGWRLGTLVVGACLVATGVSFADDDTVNLKLKKAPAMSGGIGPTGDFVYEDARARADEDDTEDVNLRYRLGYNRGYWGGVQIFPRGYAWRSGYYNGLYGYPYSTGFRGLFGGYRPIWGAAYRSHFYGGYYAGFGYPTYYSSYYCSTPVYYSSPVIYSSSFYYSSPVVYDYGISSATTLAPAKTLKLAPKTTTIDPMAEPEPPAATAPMPKQAPATRPTYRYDGGPDNPMPQPLPPQPGEPAPKPSKQPSTKIDPAEGRLVKLPVATAPAKKKPTFAAYGEHMRKADDDELFLKQPKK